MKRSFFHFPLALLAAGKDEVAKLDLIIAWSTIHAGYHVEEKMGGEENAINQLEMRDLPEGFLMDDWGHRAWALGKRVLGYSFTSPLRCIELYHKASAFLSRFGKSPTVRVMADVIIDACKGKFSFREFSVLCAVYAIIGNKRYALVRRDRVRAGAMGYSSAKDLFDQEGKLTDGGKLRLASREDQAQPLTLDQCRYTLDKLHNRKFLSRIQPVDKGRQVFYSRSLNHDQLIEELLLREERKISQSQVQMRAQKEFREKAALLKQDLIGEPANPAPSTKEKALSPSDTPQMIPGGVPTELPALICSPPNEFCPNGFAPNECSTNTAAPGSSPPPEELPSTHGGLSEIDPPTMEEAQQFVASLTRENHAAEFCSEWFEAYGSNPRWLTGDWKKSLARHVLDKIQTRRRERLYESVVE